MGYKLKTGSKYDNGIGQELPDAYAWIDTIIVETRQKKANVILKVTANKQASLDQKKDLETLSFIVENKIETDDKGNEIEVNNFTDYIEDILSIVQPDGNLKKKAYKFLDEKYSGKKVGFWNHDDWESDEV